MEATVAPWSGAQEAGLGDLFGAARAGGRSGASGAGGVEPPPPPPLLLAGWVSGPSTTLCGGAG